MAERLALVSQSKKVVGLILRTADGGVDGFVTAVSFCFAPKQTDTAFTETRALSRGVSVDFTWNYRVM